MQRVEIAGVLIEIAGNRSINFNSFNAFSSNSMRKPDLKIHVESCGKISSPKGMMMIDDTVKWMYKYNGDKRIAVYVCEDNSSKVLLLLEVNEKWDNAHIYYLEDVNIEHALKGIIGSILFRNTILFHNGFVIHASSIKWNGKGIMFSAPSGTGKSTQSRLWRYSKGAGILNDDCPGVRIIDGENYVYGTPWSGSTDEFINDSAPLSAIVMLEQSDKNSIRRLFNSEAAALLMPRCFLPYFDSNAMNLAMLNIERVISKTPVFLLKCKPDTEAVELVYECVK